MNILYWNIKSCSNIVILKEILLEQDIDHVILSDFKDSPDSLIHEISTLQYNYIKSVAADTVHFSRWNKDLCNNIYYDRHMNATKVNTITGPEIIIIGLHLPSKKNKDENDQYDMSVEYAQRIVTLERQFNNKNIIVIGDFNFNPFEKAMVAHKAFHSVMCENIANEQSRVIDDTEKPFFYNPTWMLYGKNSPLHGTYFYRSAKSVNYFWNLFDQIIMRPSMIPYFQKEKLNIITKTNNYTLLDIDHTVKIKYSDHLPIICTFNFN